MTVEEISSVTAHEIGNTCLLWAMGKQIDSHRPNFENSYYLTIANAT